VLEHAHGKERAQRIVRLPARLEVSNVHPPFGILNNSVVVGIQLLVEVRGPS